MIIARYRLSFSHVVYGICVAAASLLAVLTGSAQTTDPWFTVHSKNFTIAGNATNAELKAAAKRLEDFRCVFSRLYPSLKLDNGRPTTVVLFRDSAAYESYLPKRLDGSTDEGVAGYFLAGDDVNYITLAARSNKPDSLGTAVHEFIHLVLSANFDETKIPPWLAEGLAEYFETTVIENDRTVLLGNEFPGHLKLLRRTGLVPLAELFAVTPSQLKSMSIDQRRRFYAESWLVVRLLESSGRLALSDLSQTLTKLSQRDGSIADVFNTEISAMNKELAASLLRASLTPKANTFDTPIPIALEPTVAPLTAAESNAILGDLLFHSGEFGRAEALLTQAVAADKTQVLANSSLGKLLIRQDKPADAKPFLKAAIDASSTDYSVYFNYAYAVSREFILDGGLSSISDDAAATMREALRHAIKLRPAFVESYRLLAAIDYVRDEELDDAVSLIREGLVADPNDTDLKLMLARIYLRREDVVSARQIAEQVSANADPKYRSDADDIVKAAYEYTKAKSGAALSNQLSLNLSQSRGLAVLKRSWLTDAEVQQIDAERVNNNLNRLIIRPVSGELQMVGHIEQISCNGRDIRYVVNDGKNHLTLRSLDFAGVRMTVAREGEQSFSIGCGAKLERELTVINYRPLPPGPGAVGEISAISFVPDGFRLKSIGEMTAARMVAIDDDTLRHSGPPATITAESIRRSILADLRKPRKDETRVTGHIDAIECSGDRMFFRVTTGDHNLKLAVSPSSEPTVGWFTVSSTQILLACGTGQQPGKVVLSYARTANSEYDGELRSIEFVPDDTVLPQ